MINLREKMVFASGTRQRGTEFAITKRAAERHGSANHPKHQQRKSRLNIRQLKTEAGEDAGANNVGNNDGTGCREEADGASRGGDFTERRSVIVAISASTIPKLSGLANSFEAELKFMIGEPAVRDTLVGWKLVGGLRD